MIAVLSLMLSIGWAGDSRVLVLDPGGDVHAHESARVQRKVAAQIDDATVLPGRDLYVQGRRLPARDVADADQRARVPDSAIAVIEAAAAEAAEVPADSLDPEAWHRKAFELRALTKHIWFVDRHTLRGPLFDLYLQIGLAAENGNSYVPPFYEQVGEKPVNYYWFLAGALAFETPELVDRAPESLREVVLYYKDALDSGEIPLVTISMALDRTFSPVDFAKEYEIFVNGLPRVISSADGTEEVIPGRADVVVTRADGHAVALRLELDNECAGPHPVFDDAQEQANGFAEELATAGDSCDPNLGNELHRSTAIYAALHPDADVWLALPTGKDFWRWNRETATFDRQGCD